MSSMPKESGAPSASSLAHRIPSTETAECEAGALAGLRVLVVEDEAIIAIDIQKSLEEAGAIVAGSAQTLAAAVDLAKRLDVSAAILDVRLGRDSVAPVARALRERNIPFLFYSGQTASDEALRDWLDVPLLAKPASPQQLMEAIARLVD